MIKNHTSDKMDFFDQESSMRRWVRDFFQAEREIQYFIIITTLFSFILLATTVYCYIRL